MAKHSAAKKRESKHDVRSEETKRKGDPSDAAKSRDRVDRASEESFPSSDPPSFNPGSTITADDDAEEWQREQANRPGDKK